MSNDGQTDGRTDGETFANLKLLSELKTKTVNNNLVLDTCGLVSRHDAIRASIYKLDVNIQQESNIGYWRGSWL